MVHAFYDSQVIFAGEAILLPLHLITRPVLRHVGDLFGIIIRHEEPDPYCDGRGGHLPFGENGTPHGLPHP